MRATERHARRAVRHRRARVRLAGTADRPRLVVYRSLRHVYAQLVDDEAGRTLAAVSTLAPDLRGSLKHGGNKEAAVKVGEAIAKLAAAKGIRKVCFDRGGFRYHGVVAALAQAARGGGLEF